METIKQVCERRLLDLCKGQKKTKEELCARLAYCANPLVESSVFKRYAHLVSNEEALGSAIYCFYGSTIWYLSIIKEGKPPIEDIARFALLYALVDYSLDDPAIVAEKKEEMIGVLMGLIKNPLAPLPSGVGELLEAIATLFRELVAAHGEIFRLSIAKLAATELLCMGDHQRDWKKLMREKGEDTTRAIWSLFSEEEIDQAGLDFGACIQILDDLMDVRTDIKNGITTAVTLHFLEEGNVDDIVCALIREIDELPKEYNLIKVLLIATAAVTAEICSDELASVLHQYAMIETTEEYKQVLSDLVILRLRHC